MKPTKTNAEWRKTLSDLQYRVTQHKDTEHPFTGEYWNCRIAGMYRCVCCGEPLFASGDKFDSGCGWPSFTAPQAPEAVATADDFSHGVQRTEVVCRACGAHLGHVFDDGPSPGGLRYCINSASLKLDPAK